MLSESNDKNDASGEPGRHSHRRVRRPGHSWIRCSGTSAGVLLGLFAWMGFTLPGFTQENKLSETRSTVGKWVQTRQLISKTKADWEAEKEMLDGSVALFESQLETLQGQQVGVGTNSAHLEKDRADLIRRKTELEAANAKARELAAALEKQVLALTNALPQPLVDKIQGALAKIPADPRATKVRTIERMQNLLGILIEIDKFNSGVELVNEVQTSPDGAEVQVTKLYFGLGQAYFVDADGTYAGVGVPSAAGWAWLTRNELAPAIQKTIAIYENSQPAAFVALPVTLK